MGTGYTKTDPTNFVDGETIEASDFTTEFNAIDAAFETGGHQHDGTDGEGGAIEKLLSNTITFGTGADTDVAVTFDGNTSDGVLTWMEDEDYFQFSDDILLTTTEKLQLRDTAIFLHSSADGQADLVADSVIQVTAPTVNVEASTAITLESDSVTVGEGGDTDIVLTFNANTSDGVLKWMEDEDYFEFSDDILVASTEKLQFRDTAIYINSSTDGQLDLVADTEIQIAATTVDVNGNLDVSGTIGIGSAVLSEAELEMLDGITAGTAAASKAVVLDANKDIATVRNVTSNGTVQFGSLSDGSITITAFVDEDDMSSNSATLVPTQQSVKAYVDAEKADMSFVLEDGDGTEVTINKDNEVKFVEGGGLDIDWTDTDNGTDGDPYDLTFTVNATQTGITSLTNTSLVIGRDADNDIDFATDNNIIFRAAGADQIKLIDGVLAPVTDNDVDLGSSSLQFKDAFIHGTLEADAITLNGTALGTIVTQAADNVNIDGGAIDGTTIGGSSAAAGTFTTFTSTGIDDNAGSTAITIDSSERVLIGTSNNPSIKDTVTPTLVVNGSGVDGSMLVNRHSSVGGGGALLELTATRGSDVNDYTILQSGDGIGSIAFSGADGTEFVNAAAIQGHVDGTPGDDDMPGRLVFKTTADGASSLTERMRLTSAGRLGIGNTAPNGPLEVLDVNISGSSGEDGFLVTSAGRVDMTTDNGTAMNMNDTSSGAGTHNYIVFRFQGTTIGDIDTTDNTTIRYNTFTGAHWAQFTDHSQPDIPLGTVMSTINEMCNYTKFEYVDDEGETQKTDIAGSFEIGSTHTIYIDEDGAQAEGTAISQSTHKRLAKVKVSDTAGDKSVYGVFAGHYKDGDSSVESLGLGAIRIASGVTVENGDLLESAGDGTARPQTGDNADLFKASTIAKITSTVVIETHDDGSFTVPCTLHCG